MDIIIGKTKFVFAWPYLAFQSLFRFIENCIHLSFMKPSFSGSWYFEYRINLQMLQLTPNCFTVVERPKYDLQQTRYAMVLSFLAWYLFYYIIRHIIKWQKLYNWVMRNLEYWYSFKFTTQPTLKLPPIDQTGTQYSVFTRYSVVLPLPASTLTNNKYLYHKHDSTC